MTAASGVIVAVYPTGDALIDRLVEFFAARLPALHKPDMLRAASLAEQWWLEEVGNAPCPLKQGWSFIYRFARDKAVERCRHSDGRADLLEHQLCVLLPALFAQASAIYQSQRTAASPAGESAPSQDARAASASSGDGQ